MAKLVSIIIPTCSRITSLCLCIKSILLQSYCHFEIIVVNNDVQEKELKNRINIHDDRITFFNEAKKGSNAARNCGLKHANGEYCAFLDDDTIVNNNWLKALVDCCQEKYALAVGGQTILDWEVEPPEWIKKSRRVILGRYNRGKKRVRVHDFIITANMIILKEILTTVGMFNENASRIGTDDSRRIHMVRSYDDVEFAKRIINQGQVWYEPTAIVYHKIQSSRCTLWFQCRINFGNSFIKAQMCHAPSIKNGFLKKQTIGCIQDLLLAISSAFGYIIGIITIKKWRK